MNAADLHRAVEAGLNNGDVDALVALYEPEAHFLGEDGATAVGLDAIRDVYTTLVAFGGRISVTTRYAEEQGDLALLSNSWSFEIDGSEVASAITSELARRQSDGTWRYVIDNPYAA